MFVKEKIVKILLIEQHKVDQIHVKQVLDQQRILYQMKTVDSTEEALQFLKGDRRNEFDGDPDVILMDIDRRRASTFEFISLFRRNSQWAGIRFFVLSESEQERERMAELGVAGYIIKPLKLRNPSRDTISFLIDLMNITEKGISNSSL